MAAQGRPGMNIVTERSLNHGPTAAGMMTGCGASGPKQHPRLGPQPMPGSGCHPKGHGPPSWHPLVHVASSTQCPPTLPQTGSGHEVHAGAASASGALASSGTLASIALASVALASVALASVALASVAASPAGRVSAIASSPPSGSPSATA
jgi:hypothetical protein